MTLHHVRVSRNFVNLGKLYSVPAWGPAAPFGSKHVQNNAVNLGDLYTPHKEASRPPGGWAYFEDGSVFVVPYGFSHDVLEKRMNLAARFVNSPSPKIQATRQKDPQQKRLIVIRQVGRTFTRTPQLIVTLVRKMT